jgi:hypothetical protein
MSIINRVGLVVGILLVAVPIQAQQGGKISFGNLSLTPGIEIQGVYDDNIYKGNGRTYVLPATTLQEKKESDWITHVKPSFGVNYIIPERGSVNLGYRGDFAFYQDNDNNNWKNNQGYFDANYLAPGGLILGINDLYSRSEDPLGSADQYAIGRVTKRWTNDLKTKVGYQIKSNFRVMAYYNNAMQDYKDILDYSQDYTENELGIGVETRFLPKTWAFLRYHFGERDYDTMSGATTEANDSDYNWNRISAGLTWDPGAKLSGEFNVGYQMLEYDNEITSTLTRREDKDTWTAATSVSYQATATTDLSLNLSRAIRNSASDNNEQFTDTGIGLNFRQQLLAKLSLIGGVSYSKNEYNTVAVAATGELRDDDNYSANLGLNYAIQDWVSAGIGYNYSRKDSNAETNEYTDNQFMATLRIVY